jgi:hypothetical protein
MNDKVTDIKEGMGGAFAVSLKRNNRQIRDDRAESIAEDAGMAFKRHVEDLEFAIKRMKREQENMLDLSPTNAQSLMVAEDFDSAEYIRRDSELSLNIRNTEIKLELAAARYDYLFGGA